MHCSRNGRPFPQKVVVRAESGGLYFMWSQTAWQCHHNFFQKGINTTHGRDRGTYVLHNTEINMLSAYCDHTLKQKKSCSDNPLERAISHSIARA